MNKVNAKEAIDHLIQKQLHRKVFELENQVKGVMAYHDALRVPQVAGGGRREC